MIIAQRLLIGGIVCLFPLLIYILLLIALNTRRRASMVPGTWDFAGVLLATSGFVLGGGPLILAGLNANWRNFVLSGSPSDWRSLTGEGDIRALGIWTLFFVTVVGGGAILIFARRHVTVFYNVDTAHFRDALEWVFGRLAIVWTRKEQEYSLKRARERIRVPWQPGGPTIANDWSGAAPARPDMDPANRTATATLRFHPLPASCNVTLIWGAEDSSIRDAVEGELTALLPNMRAAENTGVGWLVTAATALFGMMICAVVFVVLVAIQRRVAL